jgi:Arylsulfotransferase (ASST)
MRYGGVAVIGTGGLTLAGIGGYAWPHAAGASIAAGPVTPDDTRGVLHFVTRPDLNPPAVTVTWHDPQPTGDPPYFILAPAGYPEIGPGEPGLMILDRSGEIVWYSPNTDFPPAKGMARMDLQVQTYRGQPVLTWWEGKVDKGVGYGKAVIADSSYHTIATLDGGDGMSVDLHEFIVTPQNTALLTAVKPRPADLSALGGPARGTALTGAVLEVDIASGKVLFQWNSLDHVPVTDTFASFSGGTQASPFDYFHVNSIAIAPDGDLIVSARNTCAVYKVARPSGQVQWRLGGKRSSFRMGSGATFWWQHHARPQGTGSLSLFDDAASPQKETQSRGIVLDLDTKAMRATLSRSYTHPAKLLAANQGSVQLLAGGRVLVGWGNLPYFTEFAQDGTVLAEGQFPVGDQSYRAFTAAWTGHPTDKPAVVAKVNQAGGSVVYASWNGATELSSWTVLAGSTAAGLSPAGSQRRTGFETMIAVNTSGPYFSVVANDATGQPLGQSGTVKLTRLPGADHGLDQGAPFYLGGVLRTQHAELEHGHGLALDARLVHRSLREHRQRHERRHVGRQVVGFGHGLLHHAPPGCRQRLTGLDGPDEGRDGPRVRAGPGLGRDVSVDREVERVALVQVGQGALAVPLLGERDVWLGEERRRPGAGTERGRHGRESGVVGDELHLLRRVPVLGQQRADQQRADAVGPVDADPRADQLSDALDRGARRGDEHPAVRAQRGRLGKDAELGALRLRGDVRDVTARAEVDLACQLGGDHRLAAGYLLDADVQPFLGEQAVVLRDVQPGQIGRRQRRDRYVRIAAAVVRGKRGAARSAGAASSHENNCRRCRDRGNRERRRAEIPRVHLRPPHQRHCVTDH